MGLIQKATDILARFPDAFKKSIANPNTEPSKKKTSLLNKAKELVETEEELVPVEIDEIQDFEEPEGDFLHSTETNNKLKEIFQEDEESPLLDLDALDTQIPDLSSENFDSEQETTSEPNDELDELSLEPDVEYEEETDVIDLDEWEEKLGEELKGQNSLDDFTGESQTIDIGTGEKSPLDEDEIFPEEVIDLDAKPQDELSQWEEDAKQELEKDLSLEDTLLEEISKEEPLEEFQNTLDNLEKELDETKKELSNMDGAEENQQEIQALQQKLDNYLVLVEITKDLVKSKNFEDFYENLLYSIEGQVGPESIVIFARKRKESKDLQPVANDGIDIESDFTITETDSIYRMLSTLTQPMFARQLNTEKLSERDALVIENPFSEVICPIVGDDEFLGFIVCGNLISGEEYSADDFEFLKLISDLAGNFILKLFDFMDVQEEVSQLGESVKLHESLSSLSDVLYNCKSFDTLYDELVDRLDRDFGIKHFTLMLLSLPSEGYKAFSSNFLSPETVTKFTISMDSKLIPLVSQVTGMYKIENFSAYSEINEQISESELAEMQEFSVFPLIHLSKMFGMLIVHEVEENTWKPEQKQMLISVSNILSPVTANLILQTEKDTLFKNPFNPVQEIVIKEIEKANESNTRFTLVVLKVLSVTRILNLLGADFFREYMDFIISKLQTSISDKDWMSRVGEGKFAIFLQGKSKAEAEKFFSEIKQEFVTFPNPPKEFKLSIQLYSLTYPDQARDKRKFIEIIEDT
jgi:transcriptional regulator with GAF, ATPase, and Fis domain/GGDEF domain-containing protein